MTLNLSLLGWHALVCGASAGLGRASALALACQGARVTVLARRQELLEALVPELRAQGAPAAYAIVADLADRADLRAKIAEHLAKHGPLHVLVNNSGGPPPGPILEAADDDFEAALGRHLLAAQLLVQLLVPGMREAGYGRIINIVSTSVREPIANLGVSNTTRGAMAAWAKSLAQELPPGITINNVLPGYTETERLASLRRSIAEHSGRSIEEVNAEWLGGIPEKRLGRPDDIGAAVAFLASPAASYIRGVSLAVDGGRTRCI